jgi:carboxylesterase type B
MTRKDAAEKVAKLMKLANGSSNANEAATAKAQAEKLVAEHGLTDNDLLSEEMAAAFDDLVDSVQKVVASHPALPPGLFNSSAIVTDILHKIKNLGDTDKATRLKQITTIVRTASFIAGDKPIVAEIKAVLDSTLKNHGLSI